MTMSLRDDSFGKAILKAYSDKQLLALEEYNKERDDKDDAARVLALINQECLNRGLRYDKRR